MSLLYALFLKFCLWLNEIRVISETYVLWRFLRFKNFLITYASSDTECVIQNRF